MILNFNTGFLSSFKIESSVDFISKINFFIDDFLKNSSTYLSNFLGSIKNFFYDFKFINPFSSFNLIFPYILLLLLLIPFLYRFIKHSKNNEKKAIRNFYDIHFYSKKYLNKKRKYLFFILVFFLTVISLSMPNFRYGEKKETKIVKKVIFILDHSISMKTSYMNKLTKLKKCKYVIENIVNRSRLTQFSLIVFAKKPYISCPFTMDKKSFLQILYKNHDKNIGKGSSIDNSLELVDLLTKKDDTTFNVFLFTDGDIDGIDRSYVEKLAKKKVKINTIGIGSIKGEPLVYYENDEKKKIIFNGKVPYIYLKKDLLIELSRLTNGKYFDLDYELERNILSSIEKSKTSKREVEYAHYFHFFPFINFLILLLIVLDKFYEKV